MPRKGKAVGRSAKRAIAAAAGVALRKRPSVVLLIETSNAYARGLLEGIAAYVREHGPWSLDLPELRRGELPPGWLARRRADGIIARIENAETARAVKRTGLPVVDVSAARLLPDVAWVETDDEEIARLAFEHLHQRGFRRFAYCGDPRFNWSQWREAAFAEQARAHGATCEVFHAGPSDRDTSWSDERRRLIRWVASLARPVGIFACYDIQAQRLLDACREAQVAVPEQAAVLGVDDDALLCDLSTPALSSIRPNAHRTGYLAASLLDRSMRGEPLAPQAYRIAPLGVATRQSTDVLAIDDAEVAAAVRFIREHACDGIMAHDVARHVRLSRRALEHRFRQLVGRTPHEEILRIKLERVRQLLRDTDWPLSEIAPRCGFRHVEYLSVVFKRITGQTPSQFRREAGAARIMIVRSD